MQVERVCAWGTKVMASPTDILVAGGIVDEGAPAGTVVAVLDAEDPDSGESFNYALRSAPTS
jgi:hypothetical protein